MMFDHSLYFKCQQNTQKAGLKLNNIHGRYEPNHHRPNKANINSYMIYDNGYLFYTYTININKQCHWNV